MSRDQQNKLGYRHINVMVEVAKPITVAKAVYQGSYFSIHYLFFQNLINQMYALSYRVNFI